MSPNITESGVPGVMDGAAVPDEAAPAAEAPKVKIKRRGQRKKRTGLVIFLVFVALIAAAAVYIIALRPDTSGQQGARYTDYTVGTRDITQSLSGTGTLNPANSYTVTSLLQGDILTAPFEEGDMIRKDDVLFTVDSADAQSGIDQAENSVSQAKSSVSQAENSLAQAQRAYDQAVKSLDQLNIKATVSGTVTAVLVGVGDSVSPGQIIATIVDNSTMSLVIPFGSSDAVNFTVGQGATVTLDGTFEQLFGTVAKISAIDDVLPGNIPVRQVTINVTNPGGVTPQTAATATVGDAAGASGGAFAYNAQASVTAQVAGTVSDVKVPEGGWVNKNQVLVATKSDSLTNSVLNAADSVKNAQNSVQNAKNSVKSAENSLGNQESKLDGYTIRSPISGIIIEKSFQEGDTLQAGKALCKIYDLSYLTMTLNVDELDISKVAVGQDVTVTADAAAGKTYGGRVTKINIDGVTANGATSYPVTIELLDAEGLLPGMNVQAEITLRESADVVAIPVTALLRGDLVVVKDGSAAGGTSDGPVMIQPGEGNAIGGAQLRPGGGEQTVIGPAPPGGGAADTGAAAGLDLPAGYTVRKVTTGVSDGNFIEITGGLRAGDVIGVPVIETSGGGPFGGMFGPRPGGNVQAQEIIINEAPMRAPVAGGGP